MDATPIDEPLDQAGTDFVGKESSGSTSPFAPMMLAITLLVVIFGLAKLDDRNPPSTELVVTGPSMSPTLWGPTRTARCNECGWQHPVHLQYAPEDPSRLPCFRCGQRALQWQQEHPGDRVRVDWDHYRQRRPARGDLVALSSPEGTLQVKRVVAVPGQFVSINRAGQIVVDSSIVEPPLAESWERSVEVFSTKNLPPQSTANRLLYIGSWLVYHHRNIYSDGQADLVRDDDPANLALRRQLLPLSEYGLFVGIQLRTNEPITLDVAFANQQPTVTGSIRLSKGEHRIRLMRRGDRVIVLSAPGDMLGQALPSLNDQDWEQANQLVFAEHPFALRVHDAAGDVVRVDETNDLEVIEIELRRPVRYDPPHHLMKAWGEGFRLIDDHYLVIGDNGPASIDSRSGLQGVPINHIHGRVLRIPQIELPTGF